MIKNQLTAIGRAATQAEKAKRVIARNLGYIGTQKGILEYKECSMRALLQWEIDHSKEDGARYGMSAKEAMRSGL